MCYSRRDSASSKWQWRSRVQVHRFMRRRRNWENKSEKEIEEKNIKLFLENKGILEENIKLRKKALLLRQENLALLSQLQTRFNHGLSKTPL